MNWRRTLAFSRRALLHFRHDRRTLGFILAMPLLLVLVFGYTFEGDVRDLEVDVVNLDAGVPAGASSLLPGGLRLGERVEAGLDREVLIPHGTKDVASARQRVRDGERWAVLIIPENFSSNFLLSA
ncbi:MAG: hypothetical protein QXW06_01440, partial [Thermoplasmata archaeon]